MRVAFVGKGGSGKTTVAALFARRLAGAGAPVLAIDADINQHLGTALGLSREEAAALPAMGAELAFLKEWLRGTNPRIRSAAVMTKTTPPGRGSRLLRLSRPDPVFDRLERRVGGVRLMVTGPLEEEDLGVACYHSKTGAVELLLNHLVDVEGEYVVVDMTAGADAFASGLFSRFDLTVVVVEPTLRSISVLRQYVAAADGFAVPIVALGNKVEGPEDKAFLAGELGDALLASLDRSAYVRSMERGRVGPIEELEGGCAGALDAIRRRLDRQRRDWTRSHQLAVEFHRRNATAWANATIGEDVAAQIDPDFVLDPRQLTVS